MISVTKQMEAAEANVCLACLQNDNEEFRVILDISLLHFTQLLKTFLFDD